MCVIDRGTLRYLKMIFRPTGCYTGRIASAPMAPYTCLYVLHAPHFLIPPHISPFLWQPAKCNTGKSTPKEQREGGGGSVVGVNVRQSDYYTCMCGGEWDRFILCYRMFYQVCFVFHHRFQCIRKVIYGIADLL